MHPILKKIKKIEKDIKALEAKKKEAYKEHQRQLGGVILKSGVLSNYQWFPDSDNPLSIGAKSNNVKNAKKPKILDMWECINNGSQNCNLIGDGWSADVTLQAYENDIDLRFSGPEVMREFIINQKLSIYHDRLDEDIVHAGNKLKALLVLKENITPIEKKNDV